jgi:thiol-disulfide isomerase/thioredoxin
MKQLLYLVFPISLISCYSKQPELTGKEGKPIPSFSLLLPDSTNKFETQNIPTGKPSVLFYFSPYCPYCRAQMEDFIKDINDFKSINIYVFTTFPFGSMKAFYNNYNLSKYSNITCGNDGEKYFKAYYDVPGVPYIAIYGKDRMLRQAFVGKTNVRRIKEIAEE